MANRLCEVCGLKEAKYTYGGMNICKVDYNLTLNTAKRMRTVVDDGIEIIVNDASQSDVIKAVMMRRLELAKSNKWAGNRKPEVKSPSITIFGSRQSQEEE